MIKYRGIGMIVENIKRKEGKGNFVILIKKNDIHVNLSEIFYRIWNIYIFDNLQYNSLMVNFYL